MVVGGTKKHVPTPREHFLGLSFAVLVSVIWVLSSELVQQVFKESKYEKPYFVSYYSLSFFFLCLAGFVKKSWRERLYAPPAILHEYTSLQTSESPPAPPASAHVQFTLDDAPSATSFLNDSFRNDQDVKVPQLNVRQMFMISLSLALLFFMADWIFSIGLNMTSVASSSTISTLSALFTLGLGACLPVERDSDEKIEKYSHMKLVAAFATIAGVALISGLDGLSFGRVSLYGDLVNILSAFIYSLYTLFLKKQCGPPGSVDVAMLFALIGLVILVGGIPGFFVLDVLGWEKFEVPSRKALGMLTVNSLIGTVLSEYLWAKSIVLTTPLMGTLALSLTVPLSLIFDYFFKSKTFSWMYMCGVTLVLAGFVIVNVELSRERNHDGANQDGLRDNLTVD